MPLLASTVSKAERVLKLARQLCLGRSKLEPAPLVLKPALIEDQKKLTTRLENPSLLAGVEPVLRASSKGGRSFDLGSWNLDLNMNVGVP